MNTGILLVFHDAALCGPEKSPKSCLHLHRVPLKTMKKMQKELLVIFDCFVVAKLFNIAVNDCDAKKTYSLQLGDKRNPCINFQRQVNVQ